MGDSQLDLSRLALDRSSSTDRSNRLTRRRWIARYLIPSSILLGFVALLGVTAARKLFPQTGVKVLPVIVKRGEVQQAGAPLFQAAGWIEPRPTSVHISALAPGVIEELYVVEGQHLSRGEPIARLISIDAELAVEQSNASLRIREGELQRARAEQAAAIQRLENPVHLQATLSNAESKLAKATTEAAKLPFQLQAAQANLEFTQDSLERKTAAGDAIAGIFVAQAANAHATARAELEELRQRGPNLQQEINALRQSVDALTAQLELLVEERRQVEEAAAKVASAAALRDEAKLRLRQAELDLERTVIRSPMDGRVMRLVALPGTRVMGLEKNADQSSSTVVVMYDPKRLQVRADVRLEDVPQVIPGSPVKLTTASASEPIQGRVLQPTSSANIQKNTLEVKVEILNPPPAISPEMLVTATFMTPETEAQDSPAMSIVRTFVPEQLVRSGEHGSTIWIVDANHLAIRKRVQLGGLGPEGLVEITQGLDITDKLIASDVGSLTPGEAVRILDEDSTLGMER